MSVDYLPNAFYYYNTYYTPYEPYLRPVRRYLYLAQSYSYRYIFPYLWPTYKVFSKLLGKALNDTPDIAALALLAFVLLVSLKLLDMLRRQIMYWISMAIRLAMWAGVALLGVYVYHRGVEQSIEDLGWILGYLSELGDQGERIGQARAQKRAADARRVPKQAPRGRTRGGW